MNAETTIYEVWLCPFDAAILNTRVHVDSPTNGASLMYVVKNARDVEPGGGSPTGCASAMLNLLHQWSKE